MRRILRRTLALSLMTTLLLVALAGSAVWVAVAWLFALAVFTTWKRPVLGVVWILGWTLAVEQYQYSWFRPFTLEVPLYDNISHFTPLAGMDANPLELMLVSLAVVLLLRARKDPPAAALNPFSLPVGLFGVAVTGWVVYGILKGGAMNVALWEVRALAYFCLLVIVVPLAIRSERDVRTLMWAAIAAVGVKVLQGVWNYLVVLGGDLSGVRSVTPHEDALFIAWLTILGLAFLTWRTGGAQARALAFLAPAAAMTFVATDRRAAYAALFVGLVLFTVLAMTDVQRRSAVVRVAVSVAVVAGLVVGLGWNMSGPLGAPASVVRSITAPEDAEDIESTLYRRHEEASLLRSVRSKPVFGLGFGRPFQEHGTLVDIGFKLSNVIPHNEILWVWSKMGTVGFALFWAVMGGIIASAVVTFRKAGEPYFKAVAALVACAVPMQLIVAFVDLQLTYARNMVFLGVLVGVLAVIPVLDARRTAVARGAAR